MNKPSSPEQLALDLLPRSICAVQVAAVIADKHGIFAWGWNSVGSGFGEHAEAAAIRRANKKRLNGATIYVASQRLRNGKMVPSKPCESCQNWIANWDLQIMWRDGSGKWRDGS